MSRVIRCDGPGCRELTDQYLEVSGWYTLQQGQHRDGHFHAAACVVAHLQQSQAACAAWPPMHPTDPARCRCCYRDPVNQYVSGTGWFCAACYAAHCYDHARCQRPAVVCPCDGTRPCGCAGC